MTRTGKTADGVVLRGTIRVDATRAAQKARDHLLGEPTAWLCEIVRAATSSGATFVDVRWDTDDVFVRWDGAPFPRRVVSNLAGHLFAGDGAVERRARLLAIAIFAALGHEAVRVTLHARVEDDGASPIHAAVFDRDDLGDAPGERKKRAGPDASPADGGAVLAACLHVKRRTSLGALARAALSREPPEVTLLRDRLSDRSIPVSLQGVVARSAIDEPIFRVDVDTSGAEQARLEITGPRGHAPELLVHELGVLLARVPLAPGGWFSADVHGMFAPVRVVVHAERLATNVSRTRPHDEVVARVSAGAIPALATSLEVLRTAVAEVIVSGARSPRSRVAEDALGALGAVQFHGRRLRKIAPGDAVAAALAATQAMPLLADAAGRPRSFDDLLTHHGAEIHEALYFVYAGDHPLGPELAHFVEDVFWSRGRAADRALRGHSWVKVESEARAGARLREHARARDSIPLQVPQHPEHLAVHRFDEEDALVAVVAIRPPGRLGPPTMRVWLDGQPIAGFTIDGHDPGGLAFDAAVAWSGVFVPTRGYDAVAKNGALERAVARVTELSLRVLDEYASGLPDHRIPDLRGAFGAVGPTLLEGPLADLAVWPDRAGRMWSTAAIQAEARLHGGIRHVLPDEVAAVAGAGCPARILVLSPLDRRALERLLPGSALVPYAAALLRGPATDVLLTEILRRELGEPALPVHVERIGKRVIASTFASRTVCLCTHRGEILSRPNPTEPLAIEEMLGGHAQLIDDDEIFPRPGAAIDPPPFPVTAVVSAFLDACERALDLAAYPWAGRQLLVAATSLADDEGTRSRLRRVPLFVTTPGDGQARMMSAEQITAACPEVILWTPSLPDPPVDAALLVVLPGDVEAAGLRALVSRRLEPADLAQLRSRAEQRQTLAALRKNPLRDPARPPERAALGAPSVEITSGEWPGVLGGCIAPMDIPGDVHAPVLTLLFEGHEVGVFTLDTPSTPVALLLDVDSAGLLPQKSGAFRSDTRAAFARMIDTLTGRIGLALAAAHGFEPFDDVASTHLLALSLEAEGLRDRATSALLTSARTIATVQGERAPLAAIVRDDRVLYGRTQHAPWPRTGRRHHLDEPILLAPPGPLGNALLRVAAALTPSVEDVSDEVAALAVRRSQPEVVLLLDGAPPHPRLRLNAEALGVPNLEGELEIISGRASSIVLVDARGKQELAQTIVANLPTFPCSVRALLRISHGDPRATLERVAVAVAEHVERLVPDLQALPPFVGASVRALVGWRSARRDAIPKDVLAAPVFPLRGSGELASFTDLSMTVPLSALDVPIAERVQLRESLIFAREQGTHDLTDALRTVAAVAFHSIEPYPGEVALFGDSAVDPAPGGVRLVHRGTEVGRVRAILGFRAHGRVTVADLTSTELDLHDLTPDRRGAVLSVLRSAALRAVDGATSASSLALARTFVDTTLHGVEIAGWAHIPLRGTARVDLTTPSGATSESLSIEIATPQGPMAAPLPMSAKLFASATPPKGWARELALPTIHGMLALCNERHTEELAWYFGLLRPSAGPPPLSALDAPLPTPETLSSYAAVIPLICDPRGSGLLPTAEGLLVGSGHPLTRTLFRFLPRLLRPARPSTLESAPLPPEPERQSEPAPEPGVVAAPAPAVDVPRRPAPPPNDTFTAEPDPGFFDGLLGLFGQHRTWSAPATHRIHKHLTNLFTRLPIPEGATLVFTRAGRPVRYDGGDNQVAIDPGDPMVDALVKRGDYATLAMAAMAEIDRELDRITVAEERRAILALLEELSD